MAISGILLQVAESSPWKATVEKFCLLDTMLYTGQGIFCMDVVVTNTFGQTRTLVYYYNNSNWLIKSNELMNSVVIVSTFVNKFFFFT